ncbi:MAG TPA: patatin-like phospholipase family protein, partial [Chthoniobacterales bacterium]
MSTDSSSAEPRPSTFDELIAAEDACFPKKNGGGDTQRKIAPPGSADEPWVSFAPEDRVGLAFSGGGIRSATFNLGVLQGLHGLGLLRHFHYLATVSGGGYIGAWWSVWLSRRKGKELFPAQHTEPDEIRHLREFSNFLSPRIGLFETEMWSAVLAVLSAMLPALAVANAVLVLAILLWLPLAMTGMPSLAPFGARGAAVLGTALILLVQVMAERIWCRKGKAEECTFPVAWWWRLLVLGIVASLAAWWLVLRSTGWARELPASGELIPAGAAAWPHVGIAPSDPAFRFDWSIFCPPLVWIVTVGLLLLLRIPLLKWRGDRPPWRVYFATADRVVQRFLAAALIWTLLACVWLLGAWLYQKHRLRGFSAIPAAFASSGLFALLRNWFVSQLSSSKKSGPMSRLKPLLPQILAYLTVFLGAVGVCTGLSAGLAWGSWLFWLLAFAVAAAIILFCLVAFDPALVSMHAFYRNRLARAYLGASNLNYDDPAPNESRVVQNRQIDLRANDDCALAALAPNEQRPSLDGPLHLICCAANDVGGDPLGTLARGSRSAVLSPVGFAIGNYWRRWSAGDANRVTVASAITASAAAFNSNMGSLSKSLGPAVTFLMTALNLRLGLWLRHPLAKGELRVKRGTLFLREMFAKTRCGPPIGRGLEA